LFDETKKRVSSRRALSRADDATDVSLENERTGHAAMTVTRCATYYRGVT
jgi:hypothetical protein